MWRRPYSDMNAKWARASHANACTPHTLYRYLNDKQHSKIIRTFVRYTAISTDTGCDIYAFHTQKASYVHRLPIERISEIYWFTARYNTLSSVAVLTKIGKSSKEKCKE